MEAKQHISRVKSMQHAGLCIETRTHDKAAPGQHPISKNGKEGKKKIMFILVFAIMAEHCTPGWRYTFCTLTHVQMIPLITVGALNHLPELIQEGDI